MSTDSKPSTELTLAATVSPEDLACDDYVALLNETWELPSWYWDGCATTFSPYELIRLQVKSADAGRPLKIVALCLPFVYASTPQGQIATIDTRRYQLVRLNRRCAKRVWKRMASSSTAQERRTKTCR